MSLSYREALIYSTSPALLYYNFCLFFLRINSFFKKRIYLATLAATLGILNCSAQTQLWLWI